MRKSLSLLAVLLAASVLFIAGCASGPLTTREKGAGVGALGGAALGGIIGSTVGHAGAGALIGGALGLGAGAVVGDQMQDRERLEQENECLRNLRPGADPDLCKQR